MNLIVLALRTIINGVMIEVIYWLNIYLISCYSIAHTPTPISVDSIVTPFISDLEAGVVLS